ncbi:hypothetical protein VCRA2110O182_20416 [Vibrio crassostreae]|nr:hypothetical protein VCRA2110O182_20416 [Vibrio crassostreae]CAK2328898.1 hypothetical protein VCRA2111O408_20416 [Vibrio crassostreae]CAK2345933.1 hypothetical protein VCRA211O406_20414 [Vibrio crassostreae]
MRIFLKIITASDLATTLINDSNSHYLKSISEATMKNVILILGVICGSMAAVMIFVGMLMASWWTVDFLVLSHQT